MTRDEDRPKTTAEQTVAQAEMLAALARLAPVVRLFGPRGREAAKALTDGAALVPRVRDLAALPGRFNDALGDLGWIAFGAMDEALMREASELAEAGRVDDAESLIADSYDEVTLRRHLHSMRAIKSYQPRHELLLLVAADHAAGRYHAVAPTVLPQVDGLVHDLTGKSLFTHGGSLAETLIAWDTIAGREDGLPRLMKVLSEGRWSTTTDPILVPYRHGILHGRDLGFANKVAAAKAWGALFSLREWALAVQRGTTEPPPIEPEPTLGDLIRRLRESELERRRIKAWSPAEPRGPFADDNLISDGTPEAAAWKWLGAWRDRDWVAMANATQTARRLRHPDLPSTLEATFGYRQLDRFVVVTVTEAAPARSVAVADLHFADDPPVRMVANVIYESAEGRSEVAGTDRGTWGVNDISALRQDSLPVE